MCSSACPILDDFKVYQSIDIFLFTWHFQDRVCMLISHSLFPIVPRLLGSDTNFAKLVSKLDIGPGITSTCSRDGSESATTRQHALSSILTTLSGGQEAQAAPRSEVQCAEFSFSF
jgi:hypothetical protein